LEKGKKENKGKKNDPIGRKEQERGESLNVTKEKIKGKEIKKPGSGSEKRSRVSWEGGLSKSLALVLQGEMKNFMHLVI